MKLGVDVLRYLSKDDFRVLTSVEMGMRNQEIIPVELIGRIACLKHGGTYKVLKNLLKHKLVHHDSSKYMYEVATEDGTILAMKMHRLGRVSFRAVKAKRDYLQHRSSYNWLYLSRLAALKEFAFMKALEENGFPVPNAVDCNRHCVIMGLVQGYSLTKFDFSIDDDEKVTMIDFPQMVSVNHHNAEMYFDRDVECIYKFFRRRFNLDVDENGRPSFASMIKPVESLDKQLAASGFTKKDNEAIENVQSKAVATLTLALMVLVKKIQNFAFLYEEASGYHIQFIEGEMNGEINSDDEGCLPIDENDANVNNLDSLHLVSCVSPLAND
ncbi:hypothetical protein C5167_024391 [Papaver somniferum]|uniref:non-specific serine/threonine protein kinase n=1 Tax=Papaver somniferum TaxID=3469 RepID=A0A4Y7JRS8_PAPSO|nr:hypothetical protein C5167_024391 [Papaver somniferum]